MTPLTILAQGDTYAVDERIAWLVEHVDGWLARSEKVRQDPGRFHPSDLALDDEEIIARFRGEVVQRDPDVQKIRVFDNGHAMHRRWGRYFKKAGLTDTKHKKNFWMPRLRLKGACDEIIHHPETGETLIVELKSMNPFQFSKLVNAIESHVDQLHCYMAGLRILQGVVLYECKGTQAVKAFPVRFDEARWHGIEDRLRRLRQIAEDRPRWEDSQPPAVVDAARALRDALNGAHDETGEPQRDLREHPALQTRERLLS